MEIEEKVREVYDISDGKNPKKEKDIKEEKSKTKDSKKTQ